jgi:hypothetical protein
MRSISDILADPNGGSRMSAWFMCGLVLLAGLFGATTTAVGLINDSPYWWMGLPLVFIALPEGVKFAGFLRKRYARR